MNTINEQRQTPDSTTPQEGDETRGRLIALRRDPAIRRESATQIRGNNPFTRISLEHNALLNRQLHALRRSARSAAAQTEALGDSASAMSGWNQTALLQLESSKRQEAASRELNGTLSAQLAQHRDDVRAAERLILQATAATQVLMTAQNDLLRNASQVAERQAELLASIDARLEKVAQGAERPEPPEIVVDKAQSLAVTRIAAVASRFDPGQEWNSETFPEALREADPAITKAGSALETGGFRRAVDVFNEAIGTLRGGANDGNLRAALQKAGDLFVQSIVLVAASALPDAVPAEASPAPDARKARKARR